MKKIAMMLGAGVVAAAAFAAPSWIEFSSTGPDKYADGETVVDGEVYALVWVADGEEFAGIDAEGNVLAPGKNAIVCRAAVAEKGACPKITYIIDRKDGEEFEGGRYEVYLFDTRVSTYSENGEKTGTTAGLKQGGTAFSGWGLVTADITTSVAATAASPAQVSASAEIAPDADIDALKPVVTGITVKQDEGLVYINVANTKPFLKYEISAKKTLGDTEEKSFCTGVQGTADGALTLVYKDDPENRYFFYKVVRSK